VDIRAQQAREHHQAAVRLEAEAGRRRDSRDRLIMELRAEDPRKWTMRKLASDIGCAHQLIAIIIRQRGGR
jgi:hypothetical protein